MLKYYFSRKLPKQCLQMIRFIPKFKKANKQIADIFKSQKDGFYIGVPRWFNPGFYKGKEIIVKVENGSVSYFKSYT